MNTIADCAQALRNKTASSVSMVDHALANIEKLDRGEHGINSVIDVNPDALKIAHALDREAKAGRWRGPLHGVPILLKDNVDTGDRMLTTAGSIALADHPAPDDAFIVERLRAAGAVILGKTNMSEWANFRGDRSISGWSSRGGQTRNPHDLRRSPVGSSSGSAAAVAAGICVAAIGTETDGSITYPASVCGVVGFKPTVGMLSRTGIIPISSSQDTAGPMTNTVADAAVLMLAMAGVDRGDPRTRESRAHVLDGVLAPDALLGARLGVPRDLIGTNPKVLKAFERALAIMRAKGAVLIDVKLGKTRKGESYEYTVMLNEFKVGLNRYLKSRRPNGRIRSLSELIAFNDLHADVVLKHFGQERLIAAQACGPQTRDAYEEALRQCRVFYRDTLDSVARKHRLDAFTMPTSAPAWLIDTVNGDSYNFDGDSTSPAAVAGYPHLAVPGVRVEGLPIGTSFIGLGWTDATVLAIGHDFEQAVGSASV